MNNVNKNIRPFKAAFQNVRSLNNNKLATITQQLQKGDIIFMNEVNKKEFIFPDTEGYFFHHDPTAYRIAVVASKLIEIKPISIGLLLTQERTQADKNAIQSFIYQIKIHKTIFFIESFYCIPNLSRANLDSLFDHLERQAQKYPNYFCGGDFNLNIFDKNIATQFNTCTNLKQRINKYTRIQNSNVTNANGFNMIRTSKTIIDLILTNPGMDNFYKSSCPIDIEANSLPQFPIKHTPFDHKCVTITFNLPTKFYFRKVTYFKNPNDRPVPNPKQVKEINEKIDQIDMTNVLDYDHLIIKIRSIIDPIIPTNPIGPTEKTLYKVPFSKSLILLINKKHRLDVVFKTNAQRDEYKKIRNEVKTKCEKETKNYYNNLFKKTTGPSEITDTLKHIQQNQITNIKGNPDKIVIKGHSGKNLANELAAFMKKRAEELVPDQIIQEAGLPPPPLREGEVLPNRLEISLPVFDKLSDFIPTNKLSNAAGPDRISAKLISLIWPSFKTKLNAVVDRDRPSYPAIEQGYIQRTIPKSVTEIKEYKDMRPIAVLNSTVKYLFNKPIAKQIRDHLVPIFDIRNNFSYRGTHMCIISTLDKIMERVEKKKPTVLVKYDFSNAFGTLHLPTLNHTLQGLNLSDNTIEYITNFFIFQRNTQTIVSDKTGIHYSKITTMNRGAPQGQIGSDLFFLIQQLVLRELEEVYRSLYVDDLNDVASSNSEEETVQLALSNERVLVDQVKQIGFMLNDGKTEYAPFNLAPHKLAEVGIREDKIKRKTCILGFPFNPTYKHVDVEPAANMIIQRLNEKIRTTHAVRGYVSDCTLRVKLARSLIYQSIGELHMVRGYEKSNRLFDKIQVKVNDVLRATGLRKNTPSNILHQVLGTSLADFADHCIIVNGLKMFWSDKNMFGRSGTIRKRFAYNSYSNCFVLTWNDLDKKHKKKILNLPNIKAVKRFLRKLRKKKYKEEIHTEYKWIDFSDL